MAGKGSIAKKKSEQQPSVSLESSNPDVQKPRLCKLVISNFRAITAPVSIDLDDIVVLVGANNAGKSSILKAYEVAMSQGSSAAKLNLEDFPNEKVEDGKFPTIELVTAVYDNSPGDKWIDNSNHESLVRERWIWSVPGEPKREGYNVEESRWDENVPWGAPNVANARRPVPHRIDAFDNPVNQAEEIIKILTNILIDRIKLGSSSEEDAEPRQSAYAELLEKINQVRKQIVSDAEEEIKTVQNGISELMSKIFPGYVVEFDARPESDAEKSIQLFKSGATLKMGPSSGYKSTVDRHGSGARRTLLWSALKFIEESGLKTKKTEQKNSRPHLLLIDEPEICLHPEAIRDARTVLYQLPSSGNWQVMVTTHSPAFIDLSRDNTTIIRVDRNKDGEVVGTTLYRPTSIQLDEDEKKQLKLLNMFDPYVAEFFFCSNNIIVEGDTEYTALRYIIDNEPDQFKNIHIIRARGKITVVSIAKILNQFSSKYSILHDSDHPKTRNDKNNPAWTANQKILDITKSKKEHTEIRLLASKINFEQAFFGTTVEHDKPYNALTQLKKDDLVYQKIRTLLVALTNFNENPPEEVVEWNSLTELEEAIN